MTDTLPYNEDAERAVLGSVLIDGDVFRSIAGLLSPGSFYSERHGWIYEGMARLDGSAIPIDFVTVCDELQKAGRLDDVGGAPYVASLINEVPTPVHAEYYADIVRRAAIRRRLISAGTRIVETAWKDGHEGSDALLRLAQQTIQDAVKGSQLPETRHSTWSELESVIGPITWAWPGWLPCGFLSMLVAEQEMGKSMLILRVGACFLRGDAWPDGSEFAGKCGKIVWAEAEASQAMNLQRARDWGLPLDQIIHPLQDPLQDFLLNDPRHRLALEAVAQRPEVRLLVVDSLSGSHREDEDSSTSMIPTIKWLAELARDVAKPVVLTHHLRKRGLLDVGDRVTLERVRGSSGITQTARMVWAIDAPDDRDLDTRRLSVIKSNLAPKPGPLGFTIGSSGLVFCEAPVAPRQETLQDRAADLLMALLAHGPSPATELQSEFEEAGISWDAAKRAKAHLGIVTVKKDGHWIWSLPAQGKS